ncbi:hypothetical protein [Xenorhabdus sp. SGI240]|uniref:hypothetical protein n=1 Tax=Xenorhabdus sp. SGI240 TaxID=3158262 RepID=UPI0032B7F693
MKESSNGVPARNDIQNQLKILTERKAYTVEGKVSIADLEKAHSFFGKIESTETGL